MKKKKSLGRRITVKIIFLLLVLVLLAAVIPTFGVPSNSPQFWIDVVEFFKQLQEHFMRLWMFYFFALSALMYITK